jgi:hypothetical protein
MKARLERIALGWCDRIVFAGKITTPALPHYLCQFDDRVR